MRSADAPDTPRVVAVLTAGVLAISTAAILIRLAAAESLAISLWRVTFSLVLIAPVVALSPGRRAALAGLDRGHWLRLLAAGICLGIHFWTWITSLALTTVAASVLLVTTNPIWVGLLSPWVLGERPGLRQWIGIAIATAGACVVALFTGSQDSAPAPLLGNALALAGAISGSGYLMFGRAVRQRLDLWSYTAVTLALAWVVLAIAALGSATTLTGFDTATWLALGALAIGPQLIGHTSISWSLRWVRADIVAVCILFEPIGSAVLAWAILSEVPTLAVIAGGAILLVGLTTAISGRRRPLGRTR